MHPHLIMSVCMCIGCLTSQSTIFQSYKYDEILSTVLKEQISKQKAYDSHFEWMNKIVSQTLPYFFYFLFSVIYLFVIYCLCRIFDVYDIMVYIIIVCNAAVCISYIYHTHCSLWDITLNICILVENIKIKFRYVLLIIRRKTPKRGVMPNREEWSIKRDKEEQMSAVWDQFKRYAHWQILSLDRKQWVAGKVTGLEKYLVCNAFCISRCNMDTCYLPNVEVSLSDAAPATRINVVCITSGPGCVAAGRKFYWVVLPVFVESWFKVACTSGPFFEKNYQALPHIFFTDKLPSDWSKA